jgi:hypothetical protein
MDAQMTKDEIIDYLLSRLSKSGGFYYTIQKVKNQQTKTKESKSIRFLDYHYSRTKIKYDVLYELPINELVNLRNAIKTFGDWLRVYHEYLTIILKINIIEISPDFNTLRMNKHMIPEVLDAVNGVIGKRNMKAQQQKKIISREMIRKQ